MEFLGHRVDFFWGALSSKGICFLAARQSELFPLRLAMASVKSEAQAREVYNGGTFDAATVTVNPAGENYFLLVITYSFVYVRRKGENW